MFQFHVPYKNHFYRVVHDLILSLPGLQYVESKAHFTAQICVCSWENTIFILLSPGGKETSDFGILASLYHG